MGFEGESGFSPARDPRIGEVVGEKHRIVRRLGQGGMASVYEARHVVIDRRVALKFLHPLYANDPEALGRFHREARTAGSLESEHIAAALDFGTTSDQCPYSPGMHTVVFQHPTLGRKARVVEVESGKIVTVSVSFTSTAGAAPEP